MFARARCRPNRDLALSGVVQTQAHTASYLHHSGSAELSGATLTLIDVAPQTAWHASHPIHSGGFHSTEEFVGAWPEDDSKEPEKAAAAQQAQLSCLSTQGAATVPVDISNPIYSGSTGTLTYQVANGGSQPPLTCTDATLTIPNTQLLAATGAPGAASRSVWFLDLQAQDVSDLLVQQQAGTPIVPAGTGLIGQFSRKQADTLSTGPIRYTVGITVPNHYNWWEDLPASGLISSSEVIDTAFNSDDALLLRGLASLAPGSRVLLTLDLEVRDNQSASQAAAQAVAILWALRKELPNVPLWPTFGSNFVSGLPSSFSMALLPAGSSAFKSDLSRLALQTPFDSNGIQDLPSFLWVNGLIDGIVAQQYSGVTIKQGKLVWLQDYTDPGAAYSATFDYTVMSSTEPGFGLPTGPRPTSDYCNQAPAGRVWPGARFNPGWQVGVYFVNSKTTNNPNGPNTWTDSFRSLATQLVPNANCPLPAP